MKTWGYYSKWNKSVTVRQIFMYDSTSIGYTEQSKSESRMVAASIGQGEWGVIV